MARHCWPFLAAKARLLRPGLYALAHLRARREVCREHAGRDTLFIEDIRAARAVLMPVTPTVDDMRAAATPTGDE